MFALTWARADCLELHGGYRDFDGLFDAVVLAAPRLTALRRSGQGQNEDKDLSHVLAALLGHNFWAEDDTDTDDNEPADPDCRLGDVRPDRRHAGVHGFRMVNDERAGAPGRRDPRRRAASCSSRSAARTSFTCSRTDSTSWSAWTKGGYNTGGGRRENCAAAGRAKRLATSGQGILSYSSIVENVG